MENEQQSPVKQVPKVIMIWHLGTGVLIDGAFAELHGLRHGQLVNNEEVLFEIIRRHSAQQMDKMRMVLDAKNDNKN